jgi:hypothetical protein
MGRRFNFFSLCSVTLEFSIGQHRHPGDSRQHLFKQLEPLAAQLRRKGAQSGDVAAGVSQTGDQTVADRIGWIGHDDGNSLGGAFSSLHRR